jgi:hypothetical protein
MKKIMMICSVLLIAVSSHAQQNFRHSVGVDIGHLYGVSLKLNLVDNLYLQGDFGATLVANPLSFIHYGFGPFMQVDLGGQIHVLYEKPFNKHPKVSWLAGGGGGFGKECLQSISSPFFKAGATALFGLEWTFGIPLSLQLDTRLGYGVAFALDKSSNNSHFFYSVDEPYHFFDYALVFSIRYCFGKR